MKTTGHNVTLNAKGGRWVAGIEFTPAEGEPLAYATTTPGPLDAVTRSAQGWIDGLRAKHDGTADFAALVDAWNDLLAHAVAPRA